jgi:hypothetical protein
MRADVIATFRRLCLMGLSWVALVVCGTVQVAKGDGPGGSEREVEFLKRQVQYLADELAGARAESDALKARLDRKRFDEAGGAGTETAFDQVEGWGKDYKILEINEELGIAVLKAGRRQGIRPGLQFAVMRGDRAIARLRVIDVRETIAGAVLEKIHGGSIGAHDRAVLVTGTRE